jgi:hypothetical protein
LEFKEEEDHRQLGMEIICAILLESGWIVQGNN